MNKISHLKKNGYRITKPREEILNVLNRHPLTVEEIHTSLLKKKISVDITSIYRSLDLFKKLGLVTEIELGEGKKRYEFNDKNKHHHHIVCEDCGMISDISLTQEKKLIDSMKKNSKFKITGHLLEFSGLCQDCQC